MVKDTQDNSIVVILLLIISLSFLLGGWVGTTLEQDRNEKIEITEFDTRMTCYYGCSEMGLIIDDELNRTLMSKIDGNKVLNMCHIKCDSNSNNIFGDKK